MILDNAFVSVAGVDLSDYVREVTVDDSTAEVNNRTMGMTADSVKAGTPQWSITVKFIQDYTPAKVHATLLAQLRRNDVPLVVRPDKDAAISAENPNITGVAYFGRYSPVSGAAGSQQEPTAEFKNAGTALEYVTVEP